MDKMELIDSDVTLDELFEWLKDEIKKGKFSQFNNKTDEESFDMIKVAKPLIEIKLKFANTFAWEQINSIKKKNKN